MKTPILTILSIVVIAGIVATFVQSQPSETAPPADTQEQPTTEQPATETPTPEPTPPPTVFYPLPDYKTRITERAYGQHFTTANAADVPCGGRFGGYHNGDDLEVTSAELNPEVPVFAVANGTVRQFNTVGGYGGLLIIEYTLGGQVVTANYGHVDLNQPKVNVGSTVTAGQIVGYLGAHCSTETDGERKHLHFSIHKGSSIDVKGYVQNQSDLANWINPAEFLTSLRAAEPKP